MTLTLLWITLFLTTLPDAWANERAKCLQDSLKQLYSRETKALDEEMVLLAGQSGIYRYVTKGNEDLVHDYLAKMREKGKTPQEILDDLKETIRSCKM